MDLNLVTDTETKIEGILQAINLEETTIVNITGAEEAPLESQRKLSTRSPCSQPLSPTP